MARHAINADRAFAMLREHSQHNGRKLSDIAAAVVESHLLLLPLARESAGLSHADPFGAATDGATAGALRPAD
jgi:hypothetical protein